MDWDELFIRKNAATGMFKKCEILWTVWKTFILFLKVNFTLNEE